MPDLDAIRARLADQQQIVDTYEKYGTEPPYEVEIYVRDVTALLAALDAKAQGEDGFIPRGDSDQMTMFDLPEMRKCRVCSL